MKFKVISTEIEGLYLIESRTLFDDRGFFRKTYQKSYFCDLGLISSIGEEFFSKSKYGTLRGLHFQTKNPQTKLINVIKGKIFDVAVDLRVGSITYGKYFGVELSDENNMLLLVPEGFAHGFLTLEDNTIVSYLCSTEYEPDFDSGLVYNDPDLGIQWPLLDVEYIISERDKMLNRLKDFPGFNVVHYEE